MLSAWLTAALCAAVIIVAPVLLALFAEDEPENEIRHHDDPPEHASRVRDQAVTRMAA